MYSNIYFNKRTYEQVRMLKHQARLFFLQVCGKNMEEEWDKTYEGANEPTRRC